MTITCEGQIEAPGKRLMKPTREPVFDVSSLSSLLPKKMDRFFSPEAVDYKILISEGYLHIW